MEGEAATGVNCSFCLRHQHVLPLIATRQSLWWVGIPMSIHFVALPIIHSHGCRPNDGRQARITVVELEPEGRHRFFSPSEPDTV